MNANRSGHGSPWIRRVLIASAVVFPVLLASNAYADGTIATCATSEDCDDGLFCNGYETCDGGTCGEGVAPCDENQICNENSDVCSGTPGPPPGHSLEAEYGSCPADSVDECAD